MVVYKRGDKVYISTTFEEKDKLKRTIRGAQWDSSSKLWVAPATISTFRNLREFDPAAMKPEKLSPEIREWYTTLLKRATRLDELQKGAGERPTFPENFFLYPPYKHQEDGIAFCLNLPKSALWLDLGLGKTFTSIHVTKYRAIYNNAKKTVIVLPVSLMDQWAGEIERFFPGNYISFIDGTPERKRKRLNAIPDDKISFSLVSYESVGGLLPDLQAIGFDNFILDEATKIKNPKAKRTKSILSLCNSIQYGIELTGLPYLNNPTDLFSQFQALDTTVYGHDQWGFEEHYIDWMKMPFGRVIRGFKKMDDLKRRAYFIAFSRTKKDCVDLPEKVYSVRKLPMYDSQLEWYNKVKENSIKETNTALAVKQLEKLTQVTSGFLQMDDGQIVWFDSPKYSEICDIIQDSDEHYIIWAKHREAIKRMLTALRSRNIPCGELSRHVTQAEKNSYIKGFTVTGTVKALVCQLASESQGHNLTSKVKSVNGIYLENSFSVDQRWQSESRNHRIGMNGTASYIDVVVNDTIDEATLDVLSSKLEISEYIAQYGVNSLLGGCNYVVPRSTKSKKGAPQPEDFEEEDFSDLKIEGMEEI